MTPEEQDLQRRLTDLEEATTRACRAADRACRATRTAALRLTRDAAEERERWALDEYLATEAAKDAAWRRHPFPELDHDPAARAIAIRLHRQLAGEWRIRGEHS